MSHLFDNKNIVRIFANNEQFKWYAQEFGNNI